MIGLFFESGGINAAISFRNVAGIDLAGAFLAGFDGFSQLESFCINPALSLETAQSGSFEFLTAISLYYSRTK